MISYSSANFQVAPDRVTENVEDENKVMWGAGLGGWYSLESEYPL